METGFSQENELEARHWSVLTFDDCAASGLTYVEAADFIASSKDKHKGLCIVTDEAARRLHSIKTVEKLQHQNQTDIAKSATFSDTL